MGAAELNGSAVAMIDAGPFGAWLRRMRRSLRTDEGMDVPCGDCDGCCVSGYSVQLRPGDQRAINRIPAELLVSPPGFPAGHLTLPPLSNGKCQMLRAGRCSIYSDRPQTCLDYDCRIFAAAGIEAGDKVVINKRVREWRFSYPSDVDLREHDAVRATATFIREQRDAFNVRMPTAPMGIAVFAIKSYTVFLEPDISDRAPKKIACSILDAARNFDRET